MCEVVGFKQKFLMATACHNACLFSDARELFTENRKCLRHSKACEPLIS